MLEEKARYAKDMAFMEQQIQQKRVEKDEKAAADRQTLKEYQALLDRQDAARAQKSVQSNARRQMHDRTTAIIPPALVARASCARVRSTRCRNGKVLAT